MLSVKRYGIKQLKKKTLEGPSFFMFLYECLDVEVCSFEVDMKMCWVSCALYYVN